MHVRVPYIWNNIFRVVDAYNRIDLNMYMYLSPFIVIM